MDDGAAETLTAPRQSDRTTETIKRKDAGAVKAQTNLIAAVYRAEPDALRTIADVAYSENLMWNASPEDKKWAWPLIASEIR